MGNKRVWIVPALTVILAALAFYLPPRLSQWSDQKIMNDPRIVRTEERESLADSLQLTVAEKLQLLREEDLSLLPLPGGNAELHYGHFDLSRFHFRVKRFGRSAPYCSLCGQNVFVPYRGGLFKKRGIRVGIKHKLYDSRAVSQIYKNQAAQISCFCGPACQYDFFSDICRG